MSANDILSISQSLLISTREETDPLTPLLTKSFDLDLRKKSKQLLGLLHFSLKIPEKISDKSMILVFMYYLGIGIWSMGSGGGSSSMK